MDPITQLIERHRAALPPAVLFVNPPADLPLTRTQRAWTSDWSVASQMNASAQVHFGICLPALDITPALVVVCWPKSRRQGQYLLDVLAANLPIGTRLWLAGEKRSGVTSGAKSPGIAWSAPAKIDAARHCLLFETTLLTIGTPVTPAEETLFTVDTGHGLVRCATGTGVFGEGGLDEGSALLLAHLDGLPSGPAVDVGCGCGVLGLALARRGHTDVTLCDVNAYALALSAANARRNDLAVTICASNLLADLPATPLAAIVTNPPFHEGLNTTLAITERLISESWLRLKTGGELRLVANRHLPYSALLDAHFGGFEVLAETNRFKVYRAVRSR